MLLQVVNDTKFKTKLAMIEQGQEPEPMLPGNQQPPEAVEQMQQEAKDQNGMQYQQQPLTNNFQGGTPLNVDK